LEFNVPFQHKYGYIRDELSSRKCPPSGRVELATPRTWTQLISCQSTKINNTVSGKNNTNSSCSSENGHKCFCTLCYFRL